ncbi:MAG: hypothetical protein WCR49_13435 [Opitutae bacterium]
MPIIEVELTQAELDKLGINNPDNQAESNATMRELLGLPNLLDEPEAEEPE